MQFVKKSLNLALFVVLLSSAPAVAEEPVLLAYIDVWNTGDLDRLDELVAPDFQRHAGPDESCDSLDGLKQLITGTRTTWKNLKITVDDSMASPEGGGVRGSFYGVHRRTNGIIEFPTMSMVRFEGGKIAEEWIIGDNFLPLMALGYELVPPGFETAPAEGDQSPQLPIEPGSPE